MKSVIILLFPMLIVGCSDGVDEFAFRKTLEYELVDLCGKKDKKCIKAVKSQTKDCMVKSDWRKFLEDQDNKQELNRFTREFYACIVDSEGNPYFTPK